MSELDEFLSTVVPQFIEVEKAFASGDEPRLTMWTRRDPVSVVGAADPVRTGWTEVEESFRVDRGPLFRLHRFNRAIKSTGLGPIFKPSGRVRDDHNRVSRWRVWTS